MRVLAITTRESVAEAGKKVLRVLVRDTSCAGVTGNFLHSRSESGSHQAGLAGRTRVFSRPAPGPAASGRRRRNRRSNSTPS